MANNKDTHLHPRTVKREIGQLSWLFKGGIFSTFTALKQLVVNCHGFVLLIESQQRLRLPSHVAIFRSAANEL